MVSAEVAVIDYGVGNLLSVRRALEHCGVTVSVTADPEAILAAERVVLPGVGAFANAMGQLRHSRLDIVSQEVAARGIPLLGICLGMQMLLDESEEFGVNSGLRLIPGRVVPVPAAAADGQPHKIPHIGWSSLMLPKGRASWIGSPLQDVNPGDAVYFLHSFMADPSDATDRLAECRYGGALISAAIGRGRVFGCQFHPEKSGEIGLKVLRAFLASSIAAPVTQPRPATE
jgi:imidazole glycerol-phosphate synthase subunit HisH